MESRTLLAIVCITLIVTTHAICPAGTYLSGSNAHTISASDENCILCPPGTFGSTGGLSAAECSGKCKAGYFGSTAGQTSPTCNGACTAGYYCQEGSTTPTQFPCGGREWYCPSGSDAPIPVTVGYFSTGGSPVTRSAQIPCEAGTFCQRGIQKPCPAGVFGSTPFPSQLGGFDSPACAGPCPIGHYCPTGSVVPKRCPAGRYGDREGLREYLCSGECLKGHYCPPGSVSPNALPCPAGTIGNDTGLTTMDCSKHCDESTGDDQFESNTAPFCVVSKCPAGYYCPDGAEDAIECGSPNRYCPEGSSDYLTATAGFYTISVHPQPNNTTRTHQLPCPVGSYCTGGIKFECPPGTLGNALQMTGPECNGECPAGYYCTGGNEPPRVCGLPSYYCPAGSSEPSQVSHGFHTGNGSLSTRTSQAPCERDMFCRDGLMLECPLNESGSAQGVVIQPSDCLA